MLGPILFIIFINDIADVVKGSTVRCFADDSRLIKMVNSQEDVETLQKDLDAVVAWSERNNMSLHKDKFELMTHRGIRSGPEEREVLDRMKELPFAGVMVSYETGAGQIHPEKDLRDLGVRVAADMTWKDTLGGLLKMEGRRRRGSSVYSRLGNSNRCSPYTRA